MQKITPFLWFDKNAEEAMKFYTPIFKNAKIVSIKRYPDGSLEDPMKGMEGKVLTGVFELEGQRFMALDGGQHFKPTGAVSFYVECETQEEVDDYWSKLTEGGDPKAQQCGWLQDKYGFSWQIIPAALPKLLNDPDPEKSGRVMQAMLQMKKIDIAGLEKAYKQ
ncbi:MAG: 3-demethylubiquinone-9 3-methyltransferase [Parcubacteria group bacterium Gr01-1014_106]|nr:MAG: 3-demethylubiquinone-9 3-methyltransferase [Parcubacteria group bacterium Gr01-1014_106]